MTLGFTGTQHGMTQRQLATIRYLFAELQLTALHHGGCKGADTQAHHVALAMGVAPDVHPGPAFDISKDCPGARVIYQTKPNLTRNKDIVDASEGLIAAPRSAEVLRSGTWMTVRYARKQQKRIWIIASDGSWTVENQGSIARMER